MNLENVFSYIMVFYVSSGILVSVIHWIRHKKLCAAAALYCGITMGPIALLVLISDWDDKSY